MKINQKLAVVAMLLIATSIAFAQDSDFEDTNKGCRLIGDLAVDIMKTYHKGVSASQVMTIVERQKRDGDIEMANIMLAIIMDAYSTYIPTGSSNRLAKANRFGEQIYLECLQDNLK